MQYINFGLCLALLLTSCMGSSPGNVSESNASPQSEDGFNCNEIKIADLPSGDELKVKVDRTSNTAFMVEVKNGSSHKIFVAFEGEEGGDVGLVGYELQRRDDSGRFVTYFAPEDHGLRLRTISPGNKIRFKVSEDRKKGVYRLRFTYLVDENVVHYLEDPRCVSKFTIDTYERISKAQAQTYSPEMEIK